MLRMGPSLPVKLRVFEGPIDLLLHLIDENEIDIYDIPIAEVTSQYVDYLRAMEELDLEIASEFIVMAATLMEIKTSMLLPKPRVEPGELEPPDPRQQLVDMILEYKKMKSAAAELGRLAEVQGLRAYRAAGTSAAPDRQIEMGEVRLFDLVRLLKAVELRAKPALATILRESFSIGQKMREIVRRLSRWTGDAPMSFTRLVAESTGKREVVVTFLAILELMRRRRVRIEQDRLFGEVRIFPAGRTD